MVDIDGLIHIISSSCNAVVMINLLVAIVNRIDIFLPSDTFVITLMLSFSMQSLFTSIFLYHWGFARYACAVAQALLGTFTLLYPSMLLVSSADHCLIVLDKAFLKYRKSKFQKLFVGILILITLVGNLIAHWLFSNYGLVWLSDEKYVCLSGVLSHFPFLTRLMGYYFLTIYVVVILMWTTVFVRFVFLKKYGQSPQNGTVDCENNLQWICQQVLISLSFLIWPWAVIDLAFLVFISPSQFTLTIQSYFDCLKIAFYPMFYLFFQPSLRNSLNNLIRKIRNPTSSPIREENQFSPDNQ